MAQETAGVNIVIKSNAGEAVGSLRKQLKEAQAEVQALSDKFGATSEQAVSAAKRAADLKDRIGDAKALTDAYNPDAKFKSFASVLQGVAGGFSAVQGAMGLVGVESESVEKTLLKVQSAMAFSQGINSLTESIDSFKTLGRQTGITSGILKIYNFVMGQTAVTTTAATTASKAATIAMRLLRGVIASLGIGALIFGVTALIGKIQDWTSSTNTSKAAQDRLNAALEQQEKLFAQQQKSLGQAREIALKRAQIAGASADELFNINQDFNKKDREAAVNNAKTISAELQRFRNQRLEATKDGRLRGSKEDIEYYNEQRKNLEKANEQIRDIDFKSQSETLDNQIRISEKRRQKAKESSDQASQEAKQRREKAKQEAEQEAEERLKAEKDADEQLRLAKQENYLATIKDEDERAKKKLQFDLVNRNREIDALNIDESKKRQLRIQAAIQTQNEIDLVNLKIAEKQKENEKKQAEKFIAGFEKTQEETKARQQAIFEATATEDEKELNSLAQQYAKRLALVKGNEEAETALIEEFEKKKRQIKENNLNQALDITKAALSNITNVVGRETAAGKALAVTSATIDTYQAANKALKADYGVFGPAAQIARFVSVAATIAAGLKNVKEIVKAKVPGGGGSASVPASLSSASSAPISPNIPVQATLTQLNQGTINQLGSATNRSYVVESDITNSQERIRRINRAARLN